MGIATLQELNNKCLPANDYLCLLGPLPPAVNPNLIVIKIFKASVATLFQKLIVRPKFVKKSGKII